MRRFLTTLMVILVMSNWALVQAQTAPRLRWTAGQVLLYRLEHSTEAVDVTSDSKSETRSLLKVTKRWDVTSVDSGGIATLQMSLTSMLQERTTPSGEILKYDSSNPDKSTPQLKDALSKYLNTPLAIIRVDSQGKVIEVKEARSGPASFENELPFYVLLPTGAVKVGDAWDRDYKITLPPPVGTGEKVDAVQKYTCKALTTEVATISLSTQLKTPPKVEADVVPLWQLMPEGEAVFDLRNGRLQSAKLSIDKELKKHQGEGSSVSFKSTMSIQYLGDR